MFSNMLSKVKSFRLGTIIKNNAFSVLTCGFANSETTNSLGVTYEPDLTIEQQKYLLQTLNKSSAEQLSRFNLSKNRIKKIDAWRNKHGEFNSLADVLDVDGLGVKMLDRLCKNIIETENNVKYEVKEKPVKTRGQIVSPVLSLARLKNLNATLGIHLFATGVSWARVERENNLLTHWDLYDYNLSSKKLSPADALQLVIKVSQEIPPSDVYIFEAPISVTPTAQQSSISVAAYAQKVQLLSMLMTILSTSPVHNPLYNELNFGEKRGENVIPLEPKVFFLRYGLPARLFRTLVGNERVSAAATVANILTNSKSEKPLNYSPLVLQNDLNLMYDAELPVNKEVLGQALLLTMAFMDVCIYQNSRSIKAISTNRR